MNIILNPDIYCDGKISIELSDYMNSKPEVGLIMTKILYPNGELQYLCQLRPTPLHILGRKCLPIKYKQKINEEYELRKFKYDEIRNIPCLSGCFMFIRTNVIKERGKFDDNFFMYFEDCDLCRRIHEKYKTIFYPFVNVYHAHASAHNTNFKLLFISIKSAFVYFNKWGWFYDKKRTEYNNQIINELNNK